MSAVRSESFSSIASDESPSPPSVSSSKSKSSWSSCGSVSSSSPSASSAAALASASARAPYGSPFAAARPRILATSHLDHARCFQLLGVDVILTDQGRPVFIEANKGPSLTPTSRDDERFKRTMLRQMLAATDVLASGEKPLPLRRGLRRHAVLGAARRDAVRRAQAVVRADALERLDQGFRTDLSGEALDLRLHLGRAAHRAQLGLEALEPLRMRLQRRTVLRRQLVRSAIASDARGASGPSPQSTTAQRSARAHRSSWSRSARRSVRAFSATSAVPLSGECASGGDRRSAAILVWMPMLEMATERRGCAAATLDRCSDAVTGRRRPLPRGGDPRKEGDIAQRGLSKIARAPLPPKRLCTSHSLGLVGRLCGASRERRSTPPARAPGRGSSGGRARPRAYAPAP